MSHSDVSPLRFPEFKGNTDWLTTTLGAVAEMLTEKVGTRELTPLSITSGVGLVTQESKYGREIAGDQYRNYIVLRKEDFAYNKSATKLFPEGTIARLTVIDIGAVPNSIFSCFRLNNEVADSGYFDYLFQRNTHGRWLRQSITVGARTHGSLNVDDNDLLSLPIHLPTVKEQQKIAACFSSLDDLVAAHGKKLKALKAHKKGLMQQLFPSGEEKVPRLRFAEFRGEWVVKKIGQLVEKISFPVDVSEETVYREIGIRSHGKGIFHKELVSGLMLGEKRVFWVIPGTLIVNIVFAWEQAVAVVGPTEAGMIASHRFPMYKSVSGNCHIPYLKHFLLTLRGKTLLGIASPGGAGRNKTLGQKEFEELVLLIPTDLREQEKIASLLTSVDDQITSQSQLIETLKQQKEALMQQLFPHLEDSGE